MDYTVRLLQKEEFIEVIPLVKLLNPALQEEVLLARMEEMKKEKYECAAVFDGTEIIAVCGLWFNTRFYSGRQVEVDNVVVLEEYRSKKIGRLLMDWVYAYAQDLGCNTVELNTYVSNPRSHKFYYNEGFVILGFHMQKKLN